MNIQNLSYYDHMRFNRIEQTDFDSLEGDDVESLVAWIYELDALVETKNKEINDLTDEKISLQDEISDLRGEIKTLEQDKDQLENLLRELE